MVTIKSSCKGSSILSMFFAQNDIECYDIYGTTIQIHHIGESCLQTPSLLPGSGNTNTNATLYAKRASILLRQWLLHCKLISYVSQKREVMCVMFGPSSWSSPELLRVYENHPCCVTHLVRTLWCLLNRRLHAVLSGSVDLPSLPIVCGLHPHACAWSKVLFSATWIMNVHRWQRWRRCFIWTGGLPLSMNSS